jgi:hypothetical protein
VAVHQDPMIGRWGEEGAPPLVDLDPSQAIRPHGLWVVDAEPLLRGMVLVPVAVQRVPLVLHSTDAAWQCGPIEFRECGAVWTSSLAAGQPIVVGDGDRGLSGPTHTHAGLAAIHGRATRDQWVVGDVDPKLVPTISTAVTVAPVIGTSPVLRRSIAADEATFVALTTSLPRVVAPSMMSSSTSSVRTPIETPLVLCSGLNPGAIANTRGRAPVEDHVLLFAEGLIPRTVSRRVSNAWHA